MKKDWKTQQFFRKWPRALFHMRTGKAFLDTHLTGAGVYVLYREDQPYYIGKTKGQLSKRISKRALNPNSRYYNFWNYFSAFQIPNSSHRDEIEAILISAMPTVNSSHPKFPSKPWDRKTAKMLNNIQARILTGVNDPKSEPDPETTDDDDDT
jgi:hypothetical protein